MVSNRVIKIDLNKKTKNVVQLVQGDTNRKLTIKVYDSDEPYLVNGVGGGTIHGAVYIEKPDGTTCGYDSLEDDSPAVTGSGNTLTVYFVPQATTAHGWAYMTVSIFDDDGVELNTFGIDLFIDKKATATISADYWNLKSIEGISTAIQNMVQLRVADEAMPTRVDTSSSVNLNAISPNVGIKVGDNILGSNNYIGIVTGDISGGMVSVAGTGRKVSVGGVKTVNHAQPDTNGNVSLLPWQLQYSNTIAGQSVADVEEALDALAAHSGDSDISYYVDGETLYLGGGIVQGTIEITENGRYNVKQYAEANVNVEGGIVPAGTIEIVSNGTVNVENYKYAHVAVPTSGGGIVDTTVTYDSTYWSNRGISSSDGSPSAATSAPRLLFERNLVRYKTLIVPEGFQVAIVAFAINSTVDHIVGAYRGIWNGSAYVKSYTWFTGTIDLTALANWSDSVFRIVFARTSGSATIDTSVGEDVQMVYNFTDKPWVVT